MEPRRRRDVVVSDYHHLVRHPYPGVIETPQDTRRHNVVKAHQRVKRQTSACELGDEVVARFGARVRFVNLSTLPYGLHERRLTDAAAAKA